MARGDKDRNVLYSIETWAVVSCVLRCRSKTTEVFFFFFFQEATAGICVRTFDAENVSAGGISITT